MKNFHCSWGLYIDSLQRRLLQHAEWKTSTYSLLHGRVHWAGADIGIKSYFFFVLKFFLGLFIHRNICTEKTGSCNWSLGSLLVWLFYHFTAPKLPSWQPILEIGLTSQEDNNWRSHSSCRHVTHKYYNSFFKELVGIPVIPYNTFPSQHVPKSPRSNVTTFRSFQVAATLAQH